MLKKTSLLVLAAGLAASVVPAGAGAQYWDGYNDSYYPVRHYRGGDGDGYYARRDYGDRGYGDRGDWYGADRERGYYYAPGGRAYHPAADRRGYYRRPTRCRDDGTGGTIIGAIAGGLLGNAAVGRHGDNTAGTIVGAGVGALAGRAIDRSC